MIPQFSSAERKAIANYNADELLLALVKAEDFVHGLAMLVQWFRAGEGGSASQHMSDLIEALECRPNVSTVFAGYFHQWLNDQHLFYSFAHVGMFARDGFINQSARLLYDRLNPPPRSSKYLHDVLAGVFDLRKDKSWLRAVRPTQWLKLYSLLTPDPDKRQQSLVIIDEEIRYSVEMLAIWLASEDVDPDLVRLDSRLLDIDSPFVGLQRAIQHYLTHSEDDGDIDVMISQCDAQIKRLRRRALSSGSSLATTHLLVRLEKILLRISALLALLRSRDSEQYGRNMLALLNQMIEQGALQSSLSGVFKRSVNTLSQSIAQHKSEHGEHYVTTGVGDYFKMYFAAAGAGIFIAIMALIKIKLAGLDLSSFGYAVLSSLNYGIGFVIVHMFGCTIATKQSAMTAAYMAQTIQTHGQGRGIARRIARLLLDVNRSQTIAVIGNVSIAMGLAWLISYGFSYWQGGFLIEPSKASYELNNIHPISGLSLWYAAIAALWLFCSGLIAGYYDNRAEYLRLRDRLYQHPWLRRRLSDRKRRAFADYVHDHYGALHGNFYFGVLLGMTPFVGELLHLPLDIRHVAFSAANLGYAASSISMTWPVFWQYLLFVLMIGMVNLWVSFTLAIRVALRAHDAKFPKPMRFLQALWREFASNPLRFLLPIGLKKSERIHHKEQDQ
ncbi:site-specific recombinase [Cardiobacteriaceae bacterium TAE3-ERU3]|nr:site-specific recombinase [Cardiobacteriaceae bacterium TAE3-ERU3]